MSDPRVTQSKTRHLAQANVLADALGERLDDAGVGVEEVVARHA